MWAWIVPTAVPAESRPWPPGTGVGSLLLTDDLLLAVL